MPSPEPMTGGLYFPECAPRRYWLYAGSSSKALSLSRMEDGTPAWRLYPQGQPKYQILLETPFFQLLLHLWILSICLFFFSFPFAKAYCRNGCLYLPYDGAIIVYNSQKTFCFKTKSKDFQNVLSIRLHTGHKEGENTEPRTLRKLQVCCLL